MRLELEFAGERVSSVITEAFDPPLKNVDTYLIDKGESLCKDFKPHLIGGIVMPDATGTLTLRAPEIPGQKAVDVRYIVLTCIKEDSGLASHVLKN